MNLWNITIGRGHSMLPILFLFGLISACTHQGKIEYAIITEDAVRFVALFEANGGVLSADDLQRSYIEPGTGALKAFIPQRIVSAENLHRAISERPQIYQDGISRCLRIAKDSDNELNATFTAMSQFLGEIKLPEVYVLFGAGNSGGTVGDGMIIIGLETVCANHKTEDAVREKMSSLFAHETVHTLQPPEAKRPGKGDLLLRHILIEGVADFVAQNVTGRSPDAERDRWARLHEAEIWEDFETDRRNFAIRPNVQKYKSGSELFNWVANYSRETDEKPAGLGYWLGHQIAQAYYDSAENKSEALRHLLTLDDPDQILEESGYADRFVSDKLGEPD